MRDKKKYDIEYARTKCKRIMLLLNNEKDKDIILFLSKKSNVNGFLKALIRTQIKNGED